MAKSYAIKESLRQMYDSSSVEVDADHLARWVEWIESEGSRTFRDLAKTARKHFDVILLAIETGVNSAYRVGLNAKVQFSKRLANGYHRSDRLSRIVYFRDPCRFV